MTRRARVVAVAATGTDVGKTHVTCALLAAARARGLRAVGYKPVATGVEDGLSDDSVRHARASGAPYLAPTYGYARPVSPHLAARDEGRPIVLDLIVAEARALADGGGLVVVETAGGLLSPLGPVATNVDLVKALAPEGLVLVGADRLGVLHDLGVTLGAAASRGLPPPRIVLSAPKSTDASTGTNAAEIAYLGLGEVTCTFPRAPETGPLSLAAGSMLLDALDLLDTRE